MTVMTGRPGFGITFKDATLLVTAPQALVMTTRKLPDMEADTLFKLKLELVALPSVILLEYH